MDLLKEALPAPRCRLIVFAHLAQFQLAARTQLPKAGFSAPVQPRIANLSATVAKHARQFGSQFEMGLPAQTKYRKYKSGSTSDIGHFDHTLGWEMAHSSCRRLFLIRNDSRLSCRVLWTQETRLISSRGARDLRISGLHDVIPLPGRP